LRSCCSSTTTMMTRVGSRPNVVDHLPCLSLMMPGIAERPLSKRQVKRQEGKEGPANAKLAAPKIVATVPFPPNLSYIRFGISTKKL